MFVLERLILFCLPFHYIKFKFECFVPKSSRILCHASNLSVGSDIFSKIEYWTLHPVTHLTFLFWPLGIPFKSSWACHHAKRNGLKWLCAKLVGWICLSIICALCYLLLFNNGFTTGVLDNWSMAIGSYLFCWEL